MGDAIGQLKSRDLYCASCKFIANLVDARVKQDHVAGMSDKKTKKWMSKNLKASKICKKANFPDTMGIEKRSKLESVPIRYELVANAVDHARGIGLAHNNPGVLQLVAEGKHDEVYADPTLPPLIQGACEIWVKDHSSAIASNLESLMMDGELVTTFLCKDTLRCRSQRDHYEL